MTKTKEEGGLRVRDFRTMQDAVTIRDVARLLEEGGSNGRTVGILMGKELKTSN